MNHIATAALFCAVLGSLHSSASGQTYDSSQWVPFSVHGGVQPVNGWWFLAFEPGKTHGEGITHAMQWHDAATLYTCNHIQLPECWAYKPAPFCTDTYFTEHVITPVETEQVASAFASVRAWDAPNSGTVAITTVGAVHKPFASIEGDGSLIRIYRNDLKIFERALAKDDTTGFNINESIVVNAGDRLWFHNDPGLTSIDDAVVFLPHLTLTTGPGYDPTQQTHGSIAEFSSSSQTNGWTYEAFDRVTGAYTQMTDKGIDAYGRFWKFGTTCKVWAARQQPSDTHEAVRVWTAPQDGFAFVKSLTPLTKVIAGDPVAASLRRIHQNDVSILWDGTVSDGADTPFGSVVHVRTGDRIALHVDGIVPGSTTALVGVDFQIDLYPGGEIPRAVVTDNQTVTINSDQLWLYQDREINGDLVLASGKLSVIDSTVALKMWYENQHTFKFEEGDLATTRSTVGGGTNTGSPLHTSFQFWWPGDGRWTVNDTTVQYSYGILLSGNEPAVLEGKQMKGGTQSDLIHLGQNSQVTLADSTFRFRLQFPANILGDFSMDLPIDAPITTVIDGNDIPNVNWTLDLTNVVVPDWDLAPYDMVSGVGVNKTVTLNHVPSLWPEIDGTNLQGTVTPFTGTLTDALSIPPIPDERTFLDTFNVRWAGGPTKTKINHWAVYLDGPSTNVNITAAGGPAQIAELFCFGGARVAYSGSISPQNERDAKCMATVIRCYNEPSIPQTSRLFLVNCELGVPGNKGSIRAEDGAYIKIDGAKLVNDIALQAVGAGSLIEVVNLDPTSVGAFDCCVQGGGQIIGVGSTPTCP